METPSPPGSAASPREVTHRTTDEPRPDPNVEARAIEARLREATATSHGTADDASLGPRTTENDGKRILLGAALADPRAFQSRLGEMLLARQLITQAELDQALERQHDTGERIGEILIATGAVTSEAVTRVLAEHLRLPFVDLADAAPDMSVVAVLSPSAARRYNALPFARWSGRIVVAMANPNDTAVVDELRRLIGAPILVSVADPLALRKLITSAYQEIAQPVDETREPPDAVVPAVPSPDSAPTVAFNCPGCGQALVLRAAPWVMTEINRDPGRYYIWDTEPGDGTPVHLCPRTSTGFAPS